MIQVVIDSLVRTSELGLLAVGLTMVYSVLRFPNFAHVEFAPIGAYLALVGTSLLGLDLVVAGALAVVVTGMLGVVADRAVFAQLRERAPAVLMIAAFALGIVIRESIRAIWGPTPRLYRGGLEVPVEFMGARVSTVQIGIIITALACVIILHVMLTYTKMGVAMRAAADNPRLAEASGIHTEAVIRRIWFVGGAIAGIGGILLGLDTQLRPLMGFGIIISVFAAVLLGGIGSVYGAMLGAVVVGFSENVAMAINWSPLLDAMGLATDGHAYITAGYKRAIPFVFLIIVLLFRPRGIMGGRVR